MAHVYNDVRCDKVEQSRVGKITGRATTGQYARGGGVHDDAGQDKSMIKRMVKNTALKLHGGAVGARADRPGRKNGGRASTVNVIIGSPSGPGAGGSPTPAPVPRPLPPVAPPLPGVAAAAAPMSPPGMGGPPPGGMPPPMRAAGGKVQGIQPAPKSSSTPYTPPAIPQEDKDKLREMSRAAGGKVNSQNAGIGKGRTPMQHTDGKNGDLKNVGRGPVVTKAAGGPINASPTGQHGPKFRGGAGGGTERKAMTARLTAKGYGTSTSKVANPTRNPSP